MNGDEKPVSLGAKALAIALALLAPARMAWIVFTVGENNLSNDYLFRVPLVISMLDGTCSLARYVREAWNGGGHSMLALVPVYWLNARFFAWNVRFELAVGLLAAGVTLALVAATLPPRARWTLLPLLSLLLFSTTKVTSFTFGEPALQMGLAQLGVAMGAFGFAQRSNRPLALAVWAAAGGVLASWSWGGGVMAWPVFFAAFVMRRERSRTAWAILACGAAAGLAQYASLFRPGASGAPPASFSWGAKARLVLDLLGRPLVNGISHFDPSLRSQLTGAAGLLALATILFLRRTNIRAHNLPALILIAWTLLIALEITVARTAVTAWYASPMALFWAGLLILLIAAPAPFRAGGILVVTLLTLSVQRTWEDKSFYLPSRAPVSASCLREWRTAPPGCHARVFQWGDEGRLGEIALLGDPLERHQLSVFGPRRTYLLQGDVAVGRVAVETPNLPAFLSRDGRAPADPKDFHRLDLVLAPGASVTWRVDLPPGARHATFSTVVRAAPGDPQLGRGARVSVTEEGSPVSLEERAFLPRETARHLSVDLSSLEGRRVALHLVAEETQEGANPLIFEAPRIEIRMEDPRK